jgi:hypothetical protein
VLEVVSDRKLGQLLYTYSAVASGTHVYNAQSNEYIYVGTGGTHDQSGSTTEVNYDSYKPEVISYSDYYPFHMQMPGRFDNTNSYRYGGSNGQEKETEITGSQSHYSAEYWMYDSRLGRRWNTDPIFKEWESPYASFANNPIVFTDPLGLDATNDNASEEPKKKINVHVVKSKRDETLNSCYAKAKAQEWFRKLIGKNDFFVIEAKNIEDLTTKLSELKNTNNAEIDNLYFESHGGYESNYFEIGSDRVTDVSKKGKENLEKLKTSVAPLLSQDTKVVILACNVAGGKDSQSGLNFVQKVANRLNVQTFASRSWVIPSSYDGGTLTSSDVTDYGNGYDYYFGINDKDERKNSLKYGGEWAKATPLGNQKGLNITTIYHLKLNSDGGFTYDSEISPIFKSIRDSNYGKFESIEKAINLIFK